MEKGLQRAFTATLKVFALVPLVYMLFPSEASSERLTLLVRLGATTIVLGLALCWGRTTLKILTTALSVGTAVIVMFLLSNGAAITPRVMNTIAIIIMCALVTAFTSSHHLQRAVIQILTVLIFISASAVFVQILLFAATGTIVDLHAMIFPWSEARATFLSQFAVLRVSGLHVEPGTHAAWTVGLLVLRRFYGSAVYDKVEWLAILSVASTLSLWGAIAAATYLFTYTLTVASLSRKAQSSVIIALSLTAVLSMGIMFMERAEPVRHYFTVRSELNGDTAESKIVAWREVMDTSLRYAITGVPVDVDFCGCDSSQDSGVILNIFVRFGGLTAAAFLLIIVAAATKAGGYQTIPFLLLLLLSKFFFFDPLLWLLFFAALRLLLRGKRQSRITVAVRGRTVSSAAP